MGRYLNPSADVFSVLAESPLYVDKTALIAYTNGVMGTGRRLTCFSRPRRFGKSYAAQMLAAYYSKGAQTKSLFDRFEISRLRGSPISDPALRVVPYETYLNQLDVIFLDISWFSPFDSGSFLLRLQETVMAEIREEIPESQTYQTNSLADLLSFIATKTGRKFFIIIDEWDILFREAKDDIALQKDYIDFLRHLFKGYQSTLFVAGAYMTGILPIKKYGTQSSLTDFTEFTMLTPKQLAPYVGFTENEVRSFCERYQIDFAQIQRWYDGYHFGSLHHIYNPNSVINAISSREIASYWAQSESYESLKLYIELNFDGLREAVLDLIGGQSYLIDPLGFQNDMTSITSRDDVLTLLAHLGYLAYDAATRTVSIPNEEIRQEFISTVRRGHRPELVKAVELSNKVLSATLAKDEQTVAELIAQAHMAQTAPLHYNDEQALRSVVTMAYLSSMDHYERFDEIAGGRGFIDLLFMPMPESSKPPLIIELKKDQLPDVALAQIEEKHYIEALKQRHYRGKALLIGIVYDSKTGKHRCEIKETAV